MYNMNEKEKMEAIWFANKYTNDKLKYSPPKTQAKGQRICLAESIL